MPSSHQGHDDTLYIIFCVQHQEHCSSSPSVVLFEKCWLPIIVPLKTLAKMGGSSIGVLGICGVMPVDAIMPVFPACTKGSQDDTLIKLKKRHVPTKTATRTDEPSCSDVKKLPVPGISRGPTSTPPPSITCGTVQLFFDFLLRLTSNWW